MAQDLDDSMRRTVQAKKDSYKRVYNDDGTYNYPRVAEIIIRKKGEFYFENC